MSKNARLAIFAVAGIVLLISIIIAYPRMTNQSGASEDTPKIGTAGDISEGADRPVADIPRESIAAPRFNSLESGYVWDQSNPGVAASKQDAEWLESHGFPGPDVERYLLAFPMDGLKALAERGNKPAQAIYALRLAQAGHKQTEVQDQLLKSAASGSVYALKIGGDIYTTVSGYRDPVMASVFYGLQARRGDQAGFSQRYLADVRLNQDQRLRAQVLEELMWRNIDALRMQGGARAFDLTSRPGLDEFLVKALQPVQSAGQ